MRCVILAYHSQIFASNDYGGNDHVGLRDDLSAIAASGLEIVPLGWLVNTLLGAPPPEMPTKSVCLTFDDGAVLDYVDIEHPKLGVQRGFRNLLADALRTTAATGKRRAHATSFVIASPQARALIDTHYLFGQDWMGESWWEEAAADPLLTIGNHSWDHHHPALDPTDERRGRFDTIHDMTACEHQVRGAQDYIAAHCGAPPPYFAYPYGESSPYLAEVYLPEHGPSLGLRAACSTRPEVVTETSSRWQLPRFVSGRDWRTPQEFKRLLAAV